MTPTRESVRKLAREADIIDWRDEEDDPHVQQMVDMLMHVVQAARAQALEDAATVCGNISQMASSNAPMLCAEQIRALKVKQ